MKRLVCASAALVAIGLFASRADAKIAAVYASGQGGVQNSEGSDPGLGVEVGGRLLIFDGYLDYMSFGGNESASRGIFGLRGGFGSSNLRLVLRGGVGALREEHGAVTGPLIGASRTGGVARAGAGIEGRVAPLLWLGVGFDAETYRFARDVPGAPTSGSDALITGKLQFEIGI